MEDKESNLNFEGKSEKIILEPSENIEETKKKRSKWIKMDQMDSNYY
jgi:hypothetical protein